MQITFHKDFPQGKVAMVNRALGKAFGYILQRYPDICFCDVKIHFSMKGTTGYDKGHKNIHLCIGPEYSCLTLYRRKESKLTSPAHGIKIGKELRVVTLLVHELTHYAQDKEKRRFFEAEPTSNEIAYLKMYHLPVYKKLIPVKP